jgi:hypothetical protein
VDPGGGSRSTSLPPFGTSRACRRASRRGPRACGCSATAASSPTRPRYGRRRRRSHGRAGRRRDRVRPASTLGNRLRRPALV